jgi:DNA (cytosine-5)-methyltransferase 1
MRRAGYQVLAGVDFEPHALATYGYNLGRESFALEEDLTRFRPYTLSKSIGIETVDVIVGGPPCQGFSTARQVDGSNSGPRIKADPRRYLYKEFLRYVAYFEPKVFVMENVPGIRSADNGAYLTAVQYDGRRLRTRLNRFKYRLHTQLEDSSTVGVPQHRSRQLIVGVRSDLVGHFPLALSPPPKVPLSVSLGAAIGDLPPLDAGEGNEAISYDRAARENHYAKYPGIARPFLENVMEIDKADLLTAHRARPHNPRDLRDFDRLLEGESSAAAMRRGIQFEFPYNRSTFKDRYTRQSRSQACSTIVAHLHKDGLMFIHPCQQRSLTPREAARLQTFPDWFVFPFARTHQFKMIGNAVPPLVGQAIGITIAQYLDSQQRLAHREPSKSDRRRALTVVDAIPELSKLQLRKLSDKDLLTQWMAVGMLFPDLHPISIADHGTGTYQLSQGPSWQRCRYRRSDWPLKLTAFLSEISRRLTSRRLAIGQLIPAEPSSSAVRNHTRKGAA